MIATVLNFIILLFLSALFSATEIAFFSLTIAQARRLQEKKLKGADLVWKLKNRPQRLLITILLGNNIVNVLIAALATALAIKMFGSSGVGIATGVVTLAILIFGEITPKSIAQKNNAGIARYSAFVIYPLSIVFYPISAVLIKFNSVIAHKLLKIKNPELVTEDEIRTLARLGVETGAIAYQERELIENIFKFNDIEVKEVMTPKYRMVSLNGNVSVEQIAYFVAQSGFSRYPVYDDDEDNIVGYVHVNDIMRYLNSDKREVLVKNIVRPIKVVDKNKKINSVFRSMIRHKEHIMLVKNSEKKNTIIGLVTLEDIIEELIGEIIDETDDKEDINKI